MAVHGEIGHGFLEPVYEEASAVELGLCKVPFEREAPVEIGYRGCPLNCHYKPETEWN